VILYRAMCKEEMNDTLTYNKLSFISSYKWFGPLDFIQTRVQDGKFNNSSFVKTRYTNVLEFEFSDYKRFKKVGQYEYMLARRDANQVKILNIKVII